MASTVIGVQSTAGGTYHGNRSIFEYVNNDGMNTTNCCGHAAAATALTFAGRMNGKAGSANVAALESEFPADIAWGLFGTSKARMEEILDDRAYGHYKTVAGRSALQSTLRKGDVVIVMLDVSSGMAGGPNAPAQAGHWAVAFAYDSKHVFLTNWWNSWRRCLWSKFERGWGSWMPNTIGMKDRGFKLSRG